MVEKDNEKVTAFEFKFQPKRFITPKAFRIGYGKEAFVISKENYLDFIG